MLTQETLHFLLRYNPKTGLFRWRVSVRNNIRVGAIAGGIRPNGYWIIEINSRRYRAHRLAWLYMTGRWPRKEIDHRDRVKHNNAWKNLREANKSQNAQNRGPDPRNKSGHKGISWSAKTQKWQVHISHHYLGVFENIADAVAVRRAAETQVFTHHVQ